MFCKAEDSELDVNSNLFLESPLNVPTTITFSEFCLFMVIDSLSFPRYFFLSVSFSIFLASSYCGYLSGLKIHLYNSKHLLGFPPILAGQAWPWCIFLPCVAHWDLLTRRIQLSGSRSSAVSFSMSGFFSVQIPLVPIYRFICLFHRAVSTLETWMCS